MEPRRLMELCFNKISFIVSCVGDFQPISINCLLLMLSLWACGQRACVVHHVHSEDA